MKRFKDKLALVTGAASGIGLAIARRFMEEGATVIGTDIDEQALAAIAKEENPSFVTRLSDAGNVAAIAELAAWIEQKYSRLDILVNNAGYAKLGNPEQVSQEDYESQMSVLLTGPVFFVKHLAGLLRASTNGSVINISSASAWISVPGYCPYGTAKAAIVKFTQDCVITVPGVRHNVILPGFIHTSILETAYGKEAISQIQGFLESSCPVPRIGTGADIANAAAFLASEEASYVNGTSLLVDGGLEKLHVVTSLEVA